jgi:hypothetical protein
VRPAQGPEFLGAQYFEMGLLYILLGSPSDNVY